MKIETKYSLNQALVIDGLPCVINEIDIKSDTVKYGVMWNNPFTKPVVFMSEKELDTTLALDRNYLSHKDVYDKCRKTAEELEKEIKESMQ